MKKRHLFAVVAVYLALLAANATASPSMWTSTRKAPHHAALVEVHNYVNGGAGTVIAANEEALWVLSCEHIFKEGGLIVAKFSFGLEMKGTVVKDGGPGLDLALGRFPHKFKNWRDIRVIPVANKAPKGGQIVECTGFGVDGDGGDDLRHWVAQIVGYDSGSGDMLMQTSVVSGDSGGGVIYAGELVGVIWGGLERVTSDGIPDENGLFITPARATNVYKVQKFVKGLIPARVEANKRLGQQRGGVGIIPGPPLPGAKNPGGTSYVLTTDLDLAIEGVNQRISDAVGKGNALSLSLGRAIDDLRAESTTTKDETAKAIAEARAKAKAEREAVRLALAKSGDERSIVVKRSILERSVLRDAIGAIRDKTAEAEAAGDSKFSWVNKPATWIGAAGLLGLTGIPGIGAGLAAWLAVRRLKKRIESRDESGGSSNTPFMTPDV